MSDRLYISLEEAIALLPDGETIHTFRGPTQYRPGPPVLIGADWDRESIENLLKSGNPEIGGSQCISMGHGLVCSDEGGAVFIETKTGACDKWKEVSQFEIKPAIQLGEYPLATRNKS